MYKNILYSIHFRYVACHEISNKLSYLICIGWNNSEENIFFIV